MGGITVENTEPFYVQRGGSTAVVFHVDENDLTRGAALGLLETLVEDEPMIILVDFRTASVLAFPKAQVV